MGVLQVGQAGKIRQNGLENRGKKGGTFERVSPNMIRHTFATHALLKGADLESVREIMGHREIATTQKYLHSIQEHLRKTVENLDTDE